MFKILAVPRRIELLSTAWQAAILTIILWDRIWWRRLDLNQQCQRRKIYSLLGLPIFLHLQILFLVSIITPLKYLSSIIFLEYRVRFELTVFRICNPMQWAALPPIHCHYSVAYTICLLSTALLEFTVYWIGYITLGQVSELISHRIMASRTRFELVWSPWKGGILGL